MVASNITVWIARNAWKLSIPVGRPSHRLLKTEILRFFSFHYLFLTLLDVKRV